MKTTILFLGVTLLFLVGCTERTVNELYSDDMYSIWVTVENANKYVSKIDKVYAGVMDYTTNKISENIAITPFGNGTFTLELPTKMDEKLLTSLDNIFITDTKELQVSDRSAKAAIVSPYVENDGYIVAVIGRYSFDIWSYISQGTVADDENLKKLYASGVYSTVYVYVNKPVTIKGVATFGEYQGHEIVNPYTVKYNLTYKAGWNKSTYKVVAKWEDVFLKDGNIEVTNNEPAGMKWYYIEASGPVYIPSKF